MLNTRAHSKYKSAYHESATSIADFQFLLLAAVTVGGDFLL